VSASDLAVLSISWSSLRIHEECRMRGRLHRAGKKIAVQDIRGYFPGTVADRVMRAWLDSPDHAPGQMQEMVDEVMRIEEEKAVASQDGVVRWRSKNDRAEVAAFCRELVARLEPILRKEVLAYDFEPAKWFRTPISIPGLEHGSVLVIDLIGEMDILVNAHGRWAVWDLKATKDDNYWRKTLGQLTFYDTAVAAMFGEATSRAGLIQPMCAEGVKEVSISDDDRRMLMSRIIRMAHDILKKEDTTFRTADGGCFQPFVCPVKHACPRFHVPRRLTPGQMQDMADALR